MKLKLLSTILQMKQKRQSIQERENLKWKEEKMIIIYEIVHHADDEVSASTFHHEDW